MSRARKQPDDTTVAPYHRVTDDELAQIFERLARTGNLMARIGDVLGPDRPPQSVYARIANDVLLQRRRDEAMARHRETILAELRRRGMEGVDKGVYFQGSLVAYEKEFSDQILLAYARYRIGDFLDKRSQSDVTTHTAPNEANALELSYEAVEAMPPMIRRNLIPVLTWLREWRQDRVAAAEVIEAESIPESGNVTALEQAPLVIENRSVQTESDPYDMLAPDEAELARELLQ